jgi:hypothetical protein
MFIGCRSGPNNILPVGNSDSESSESGQEALFCMDLSQKNLELDWFLTLFGERRHNMMKRMSAYSVVSKHQRLSKRVRVRDKEV